MKYKLIFLLVFFVKFATAQTSGGLNGEYVDGAFTPGTISVGISSTLDVTVANGTYPALAGEVQVFINFPNNGSYIDLTPITGPTMSVGSVPFTWIKIPDSGGSDSWLGTNDVPLSDFEGGVYTFTVEGVSVTPGDITITSGFFPDDNAEDNPTLIVSSPLPVEFTKFTARAKDCDQTQLDWSVVNEVNNKGFEVQRRVGEKGQYEALGFVEGRGNSAQESNYAYADLLNGKYNGRNLYYRLQQVDYDGKTDFSEVVRVRPSCDVAIDLSVSPNPTKDILYITLTGVDGDIAEVKLYGPTGQFIRDITLISGERTEFDLRAYQPGIYSIHYFSGSETKVERFIKVE